MSIDTVKLEALTGCACRWDKYDNRVRTCERHQGWLDVVHEWAERAKAAEAELDRLRTITDTDKASADHWRAECEKMRQGGEAVAEVYRAHYGGRSRNIGFNAVRPLVPDDNLPPPGTKLYTSPPVQADGWKVPQGWKLVPMEPTDEMLSASWLSVAGKLDRIEQRQFYQAMLSAAPVQADK